MLKKHVFHVILFTIILFSPIYMSNANINISVVHRANGHSFTPNDYASTIANIDQFLTESKLVQTNIANNNLTLAQGHADKAASLYGWKLMGEIAEKDQKVSEDLTKAVKTLQNLSSPSQSVAEPQQKQQLQLQAEQLIEDVDTKVNKIITLIIRQQESEPGFFDPVSWLISSIFGEKNDKGGATTQPLRVVELVDSVLRSYGKAYDVNFDMTDMSNMATTGDDSSMATGNMTNGGGSDMRNNYSLTNAEEYQSAQGLAAKAVEIFNSELKPMISDSDSASSISNLGNGLLKLNDSIKDRASPMDVMMIVHTQIHPNLLEAFNIPLKSGA